MDILFTKLTTVIKSRSLPLQVSKIYINDDGLYNIMIVPKDSVYTSYKPFYKRCDYLYICQRQTYTLFISTNDRLHNINEALVVCIEFAKLLYFMGIPLVAVGMSKHALLKGCMTNVLRNYESIAQKYFTKWLDISLTPGKGKLYGLCKKHFEGLV